MRYCTILPRQGVHLSQNCRSSRTPVPHWQPHRWDGRWGRPRLMDTNSHANVSDHLAVEQLPTRLLSAGWEQNQSGHQCFASNWSASWIVSLHFGSGSLGCFVCACASKVTPKKSQRWSHVLTDYHELSGIRVLLANARGAPSATAQLLLRVLKFWGLVRLTAKHLIRIQNDLMRSYEWVWEVAFSHVLMLEIEVPVQ